MAILSSLFSLITSVLSPSSNLEDVGQVLETKAVPGLMTVLDIALQQTVEYELTGTLTTSHAVLAAVLQVKRQAKIVIDLIRQEGLLHPLQSSTIQSNKVVVESFARACIDAGCDILQVLSTDKLAGTANLSDPYENMNNNNNNAPISSSVHKEDAVVADTPALTASPLTETAALAAEIPSLSSHANSPHDKDNSNNRNASSSPLDGTTTDDWWNALHQSIHDTGRRSIPVAQRRRDLWETAVLHCVDFQWAEEVLQSAQRVLRHLVKHPLVSEVNHHQTQASMDRVGGNFAPTLTSFSSHAQDEIMILLQLIQVDLPVRLLQFRAAQEHEAVVLKHLYLLKCECRAPFRAFLEAHQSVLKAPRFETVQEFEAAISRNEDRKRAAKDKLQRLLETPQLVDCLTLEQTSQHLEIEISKALYPFCELARYLDHKRAAVRHANTATVVDLQILLHRLKGLLTRKSSGHDSSAGIRPLLMDLQRVPREDELSSSSSKSSSSSSTVVTPAEWQTQVEHLIEQLELLNEFCRTRGSFRSDKKADVEAPSVVVERCARLDVELFRCHCLDWYSVVEQQHRVNFDWDALAEEIRQAELEVSLAAVSTTESLQLLSQRLRVLEQDREKRFRALAEALDDFGRRELNLIIKLQPPEARQVLTLRPTSAKGVFGIPLELAGEKLPIG